MRRICDEHEMLLIFDEVQTGMGLTGKGWCCEHFGVLPDLLCFGKKAQVCGVLAGPRLDDVQDRHPRPHHLPVALDIDVRLLFRMEIVVGLADELALGGHPAVFAAVPVARDKPPLKVLDEKCHVRQQVEQLLERLDRVHPPEEILS